MSVYYYLNEDKSYRPCSMKEWGDQREHEKQFVNREIVNNLVVSTVWLGIDMTPHEEDPHLFETSIFNGNFEYIYTDRYSTWHEAELGHKKAVEWIKGGCKND